MEARRVGKADRPMKNRNATYPTLTQPPHRNRYHGMLQILEFNWPWYAAGFVVILASCALPHRLKVGPVLTGTIAFAVSCALCWMIASVLVSHWVYDLSKLTKWNWVASCVSPFSGRAGSV